MDASSLKSSQLGANWELDAEHKIIRGSDAFYTLYGLKPQDFGLKLDYFLSFIEPADLARVKHIFEDSIKDQAPFNFIYKIKGADGASRTLICHIRLFEPNPITHQTAKIIGTIEQSPNLD